MGERTRGKDKGKLKKSPKAAKPGKRPHEQAAAKVDVLPPSSNVIRHA